MTYEPPLLHQEQAPLHGVEQSSEKAMLRQHSSQLLPVTPDVSDNTLWVRTPKTPSKRRKTRCHTRSVDECAVPTRSVTKKDLELSCVVLDNRDAWITPRVSWQWNHMAVLWIQHVIGVVHILWIITLDYGRVYAESPDYRP